MSGPELGVEMLVGVSARSCLVLALAALTTWLLRGQTAAARHSVWLAALVAVAALPVVGAFSPPLELAWLPALATGGGALSDGLEPVDRLATGALESAPGTTLDNPVLVEEANRPKPVPADRPSLDRAGQGKAPGPFHPSRVPPALPTSQSPLLCWPDSRSALRARPGWVVAPPR